MNESRFPQTLVEALRLYSDPMTARETMTRIRWPDGVVCPHCGAADPYPIKTRNAWQCKACKRQFTVKIGSVMEDSPLGVDKWLTAMWLVANTKNGISSHELGRSLGITQKSAWYMAHRVRHAMQAGTLDKLTGDVEVDAPFIGCTAD